MDLKSEKAKRDARIKAKEERIKVDTGMTNNPTPSASEEIVTKDEVKAEKKGKKVA